MSEDDVEIYAAALWAWSWTVDQERTCRPLPYERLVELTKEDLRRYARVLLDHEGGAMVRELRVLRGRLADAERAVALGRETRKTVEREADRLRDKLESPGAHG